MIWQAIESLAFSLLSPVIAFCVNKKSIQCDVHFVFKNVSAIRFVVCDKDIKTCLEPVIDRLKLPIKGGKKQNRFFVCDVERCDKKNYN